MVHLLATRTIVEAPREALDEGLPETSGQSTEDEFLEMAQESQRDRLIGVASGAQLWHDPDGRPYVSFEVKGHRENWPLRSRAARDWLRHRYFESYGEAPNGQAFEEALCQIEAKARFEGPEHTVHLRVARSGDAIYLDLGDPDWQAVEVTAQGWKVVDNAPVKFIRPRNLRALPIPVASGSIDELRPFINIATEADFRLLVAWIVAALSPTGPYPLLILNGEQGSAKSTTSRVLCSLCDPSGIPLRSLPRSERDLTAAAKNRHVMAFDNISKISEWLADAMCRLATGTGLGGRELYTDHDEAVFEAARPIILNGIPEDFANREDLADRAIIVTLPPIPDGARKAETGLWEEFEQAKGRIFGVLLDAVSCALRRLPEVQERAARDHWPLPRMVDFALWATASEPAFGWSEGAFLDAYRTNRAEAATAVIEADPVAQAIRALVEREGGFKGTMTALLGRLKPYRGTFVYFDRPWPSSAEGLGRAIRRIAPALRQVGVHVTTTRTAQARHVRIGKEG